MTNTIGIKKKMYNQSTEYLSLLRKNIENNGHILIETQDKHELSKLDGVIIPVENESDYIEAIDWLASASERKPLFVWIVYSECNIDKLNLAFYLSKNSVVEVVDSTEDIEVFGYLIKNAMNYKNQLLAKYKITGELEHDTDVYLDAKEMSLFVSGTDINFTRNEFKLISKLYEKREQTVSYDELSAIFANKYNCANCIFNIRKKLEKQSFFKVKIIRTKGYKLTCR